MKIAKACAQCRQAKKKCDAPKHTACTSCIKRRIDCSLRSDPRTRSERKLKPAPSNLVGDNDCPYDILSEEAVISLVEGYIRFVHDKPHSLFHEPTLWHAVRHQTLRRALLCAICGIGARFSRESHIKDLSQHFAEQAKHLLQHDMNDACLENIQTCILIANLCSSTSEITAEAIYFGIAVRMAQMILLNEDAPGETFIECEIRRRVWWTLFMADCWCSSGLGLPRQLDTTRKPADLPSDEYVFHNMTDCEVWSSQPGLWAYMIKLVEIFGSVLDLNRRLLHHPDDAAAEDKVLELSQRFREWEADLASGSRQTLSNLSNWQQKSHGGTFVALHLGFHHYQTLLYFQYLQPMEIPQSQCYINLCRYHATEFARLLRYSKERQIACSYPTIGHMTLVSSAVLIHTLLFAEEESLEDVRMLLVSNFEAIVELREQWPCLQRTMNRLLRFQNSCLNSAGSTYTVNRWMIRFLVEHSLPFPDFDPHSSGVESAVTALPSRGRFAHDLMSELVH